jgi:hypothetical protein
MRPLSSLASSREEDDEDPQIASKTVQLPRFRAFRLTVPLFQRSNPEISLNLEKAHPLQGCTLRRAPAGARPDAARATADGCARGSAVVLGDHSRAGDDAADVLSGRCSTAEEKNDAEHQGGTSCRNASHVSARLLSPRSLRCSMTIRATSDTRRGLVAAPR